MTAGLALPEPGLHPPPPASPPPGAITAEGVLKAALTELWEKARKAQFAQMQVLSIRLFDATDAFRMLGSVSAEKGCSKQPPLWWSRNYKAANTPIKPLAWLTRFASPQGGLF
jgi:hypothetical protein